MSMPHLLTEGMPADYATVLVKQFALVPVATATDWHLVWADEQLVLRHAELPKQGDILVDFASGAASYRRQFGGGKD